MGVFSEAQPIRCFVRRLCLKRTPTPDPSPQGGGRRGGTTSSQKLSLHPRRHAGFAMRQRDPRLHADAVLAALPKDLPPAKVYADQLASYASNEIAINWQASLVFLLAGELQ